MPLPAAGAARSLSAGVVTLSIMFVLVFTAAWLLTLGAVGAIADRWASSTAAPPLRLIGSRDARCGARPAADRLVGTTRPALPRCSSHAATIVNVRVARAGQRRAP